VTITITPPPPAFADKDTSLCIDETIRLSATGGTTYQWISGDN